MSERVKLMTEYEAADYLRISVHTLRKWRSNREGPVYHKIGRVVRYLMSDLENYLNETRILPGKVAGLVGSER